MMTRKIHLIAACGTGMGTLACILKEMGYQVTGSDLNVYPPMSDFLRKKGIHLFEGYDPRHIDHNPDLVIIGNAISKDNPEAVAVLERGIEYLSMPQAVNRFLAKDKKIILVTGTHGKTTTSSIMAHILISAGLDPSFMIGGILKDYNSSFKIGQGEFMVIEGDEYDTAFFDKGPKFMHYDPAIAIMTGIEFDHADIFKDIDHIKSVFRAFVKKNEETAHIIACDDNLNLNQVLSGSCVEVETYGSKGQWRFSDHRKIDGKTAYTVQGPDIQLSINTRLPGEHNIYNSLACIAAARKIGIRSDTVVKALADFNGIKRRQEIRGVKKGITVMDDFAHHPTAVQETIKAVRPFYRSGKLVAVFEPRTNTSMRYFFQALYPRAFDQADMVCICEPGVKKKIEAHEKFSCRQLVRDIRQTGVSAHHFEKSDDILNFLPARLSSGDLVLVMSNGGFDNIHARLLERI